MGDRDDMVARFWSYVDKSGGPDACWPWVGGYFTNGHGQFRDGPAYVKSHRFAYQLARGTIEGIVCHRCDNPPCCNPAHLFDGTPLLNAQDRDGKGRNRSRPPRPRHGADNPSAKLDTERVAAIRRARADGASAPHLAEQFGVSITQIRNIVRGVSWKEAA